MLAPDTPLRTTAARDLARPWERLAARRLAVGVVVLAVAAFGTLCFYHYRLPGLYYDEAFDVTPAMQLLHGQQPELARGVGIHLFGRDLPVMIGDYWGVVSTYAVLPLFAIFGVGVFPIRLWSIGAGMLAVLLTYVVGRRLYGEAVGAMAALLLAVFPSYVFWSRTGIYVISHIVAVSLGIMLAYLRWRESGRRGWLLLAALLTGVGLSTKLLFLWFLIAVPAAWVVLLASDALAAPGPRRPRPLLAAAWRRARADLPARGALDVALALGGFLVGAFPVIYYNVVSQGSWLVLRANLFQTERGTNNLDLWANLKTEADALRVLLDGGYFWYYGGVYANQLYPWLAGISALGLLALVWFVPDYRRYRRATIFLLAFVAVTFLLSCYSISILGPTHLLILLPIPQLVICAFAVCGGRWLAGRLGRRVARPALLAGGCVALLLAPLVAGDLLVDARYHRALARTGGHSTFSSAIYTLADDLDRAGMAHPYALDWGFKYPIMILTDGRVEPLEIFGASEQPGPDFDAAVQAALADPHAVFIAHTEENSAYPRLDRFRALVNAAGRTLVLEQTIDQLDGRRVYYVFRVE